jgi:hypothetical protein
VTWRTKKGTLVHLLMSYVQVAYRGGHVSFVGVRLILFTVPYSHAPEYETHKKQLEGRTKFDKAQSGIY